MAVAPGHRAGGRSAESSRGPLFDVHSFFDAAAVLKSMDRAQYKAMSKLGAFTRQRAKSSIRYRKDPSPPGSPPSAHRTQLRLKTNRKTGVTKKQASSPLRDLIFFAYDREEQTLIVGPAVFPSARRKGTPARLEYGGTVAGKRRVPVAGVPERDHLGRFVPLNIRTRLVGAMLSYPPRPTMHPAMEAELPGYFSTLKDSMS